MPLSFVQYEIEVEGQRQFAVPFPYLEQDHVKVHALGIEVSRQWVNAGMIEVYMDFPVGTVVTVKRETPIDERIVQFQNGEILDQENLNLDSLQLLYCLQEARDLLLLADENGVVTVPNLDYNPSAILAALEGQITESHLYGLLTDRLDQIDTGEVNILSRLGLQEQINADNTETLDQHQIEMNIIDNAMQEAFVLRLSAGGNVAGFGLMVDEEDGSDFIILADRFAIVNPTSEGEDPVMPFIVGNVNGTPTVGINGQLVVDGSIIGRHIGADIITGDHILAQSQIQLTEGGRLFCGNGNVLIDTGNEVNAHAQILVGTDFCINPDGTINDGGRYMRITDGQIVTYHWFNGAYQQFRALQKAVFRAVPNGATVNVGYFPSEPLVLPAPASLQCYDSTYPNQDQQFNIGYQGMTQLTDGTWQFTVTAQLLLGGGHQTISLDSSKSSTGSGTPTSDMVWSTTTPANTKGFDVYMSFKSVYFKNATECYYRRIKWRVRWVGPGGIPTGSTTWKTKSIGATTGWVTDSMIKVLPQAAVQYTLYVDAYAENDGGTAFPSGGVQYEYAEETVSLTYNQSTAALHATGGGGQVQDNLSFNLPNISKDDTWKVYKVRYNINCDATTAYASIGVSGQEVHYAANISGGLASVSGSRSSSGDFVASLDKTDFDVSYGYVGYSTLRARTLHIDMTAEPYCQGDFQFKLKDITVKVWMRKEIPFDGVPRNYGTWDSYTATLDGGTVLANGNVALIAVDPGEI